MVKVRVVRGPAVGIGAVTGASSLVLLSTSACAVPAEPPSAESTASASSALTQAAVAPGTGTLNLQYTYGPTGYGYQFVATNSTDEFVRVGESLSAALPAWYLWSLAHPSDPNPDTIARAKQLTARLKVLFQRNGQTIGSTVVGIDSWTGDQFYDLAAATASFVIPARTDTLGFELDVADAGDASATQHVAASTFATVPVFGGELPLKHVVFDNYFSTLRQRVIEGGNPGRGADVDLTYTDWRAATLVDSTSLDRNIGTAKSYSRFGSYEGPISGDLAYEVSYAWFADDGGGWRGESLLPAVTASRVLGSGRTAYETTIFAPDAATKLDLYFHVKVFLLVDYTRYGEVTSRRYNQGDRILLREKWDNFQGVPFVNYELPLDRR